jgi:hypothetical protein
LSLSLSVIFTISLNDNQNNPNHFPKERISSLIILIPAHPPARLSHPYSNGDVQDMRLADLKRLARLDHDGDGGHDANGKRPKRPSVKPHIASSETVGSARDGSTIARK